MFKLIKILNSGVNVPEIHKIPKECNLDVPQGTVLAIRNKSVEFAREEIKPGYISVAPSPIEDPFVYAYEINPNMLFETTITGNLDNVNIGEPIKLQMKNNEYAIGVLAEAPGNFIKLVDNTTAKENGKVIIKFEDYEG